MAATEDCFSTIIDLIMFAFLRETGALLSIQLFRNLKKVIFLEITFFYWNGYGLRIRERIGEEERVVGKVEQGRMPRIRGFVQVRCIIYICADFHSSFIYYLIFFFNWINKDADDVFLYSSVVKYGFPTSRS